MGERKPRRPMTDDERTMARALAKCTFPPASPPKRFAREIGSAADRTDAAITEKQAEWLRILIHRYRRQIPAEVVGLAKSEEA